MPVEWVIAGMTAIISTLSGAVLMLWRDHQRRDAKTEAQLDIALSGWSTQTDANEKIAETLKKKAG